MFASLVLGTAQHSMQIDYNDVTAPFLLSDEKHTAANAYCITNIPALISYLHACVGFPVIATWIHAINKGWYSTWPGLTSSRVRKYMEPSEHTSTGHMKMIAKGIRIT